MEDLTLVDSGVLIDYLIGRAGPEPLAGLYTRLRASGTSIGNEDLFIAATALHWNVPVLTRNRKHFQRVPGLRLLEGNPPEL